MLQGVLWARPRADRLAQALKHVIILLIFEAFEVWDAALLLLVYL